MSIYASGSQTLDEDPELACGELVELVEGRPCLTIWGRLYP